jgi:hypothetical protein
MRIVSILALSTLLAAGAANAAPPTVAITTCGQTVPPHGVGVLSGDLDCTGFTGGIADAAVTLDKSATLDLGGFTLTGGLFGVACYLTCEDGVSACSNGNRCTVRNGTVTGATASGISGARVTVRNVTVTGSGENGVQGDNVRVHDSTLNGNGRYGASGYRVRLDNSTANGNGIAGVSCGKFNGPHHYTGGVAVKLSTLLGNGTADDCSHLPTPCADIRSPTPPKVKFVTCGSSIDTRAGSGGKPCGGDSWCICTND